MQRPSSSEAGKQKVTCITQVPKLTSLPGLQALALKSGWNAPFCGMDVLDVKLLNLLNSQTLEMSQSFLCSNRIGDCRKTSVSKKLYLGSLHRRTSAGSLGQIFTKPLPHRTETEEKINFIHWSLTSCVPTEVFNSKLTVSRKSSPELCGGVNWGKSADEPYLLLTRAIKESSLDGRNGSRWDKRQSRGDRDVSWHHSPGCLEEEELLQQNWKTASLQGFYKGIKLFDVFLVDCQLLW